MWIGLGSCIACSSLENSTNIQNDLQNI
jgi:hypothetical protein